MTRQSRPYLKRDVFISRLVRTVLGVGGLVIVWLILGMCGYHWLANLSWIDSLLNASMIMSGMGEIDPLTNPSAKIFASVYAILSGVIFLGGIGIVASPIVHRFLHRFHLEEE
jgi:hypothetical protein